MLLWPWPWPLVVALQHIMLFSVHYFNKEHIPSFKNQICPFNRFLWDQKHRNRYICFLWRYTDCCYGNASGTILSQTCLFIYQYKKPCSISRICRHICNRPHSIWKWPLKMLKNHLCQISITPPTLQSMDKNRGFPNVIFIVYF